MYGLEEMPPSNNPKNMSRSVTFQMDLEQHYLIPHHQPPTTTTTTGSPTSVIHLQSSPTTNTMKPARSSLKQPSVMASKSSQYVPKESNHHEHPYSSYYAPAPPHPTTTTVTIQHPQPTFSSSISGSMDDDDDYDDEVTQEDEDTLSVGSTETWRKHGKAFRAQLVLMDEEKGGNTFVLSNNCAIDRYYRVAERVSKLLHTALHNISIRWPCYNTMILNLFVSFDRFWSSFFRRAFDNRTN